ncbi:hypothetical protein NECAME_07656 [Necator americanus]|uniref:Uncharacterized protein n=1 Tax=Necator americanus TaxID=51031 RepID=W2TPM3_NECAM|nr:hypothetical protein NECAME_07656 [Necator americanus]ETN82942.1 hypothetical protein NECAME_07656 [Necator americanus]
MSIVHESAGPLLAPEMADNPSSQSSTLEDVPAITAVPVPKPRTIKSSAKVSLKPVPPTRKPLASSFVNVRNAPLDRDPVDVIVDVNNGLWRNVRIEDMDVALINGDPSTAQKTVSDEKKQRQKEKKSGYENECENDSISVQMEDITSDEATQRKAYASKSYESDETASNLGENMMIKGPEWVVPQEYSSSPIVKELAESCEEVCNTVYLIFSI